MPRFNVYLRKWKDYAYLAVVCYMLLYLSKGLSTPQLNILTQVQLYTLLLPVFSIFVSRFVRDFLPESLKSTVARCLLCLIKELPLHNPSIWTERKGTCWGKLWMKPIKVDIIQFFFFFFKFVRRIVKAKSSILLVWGCFIYLFYAVVNILDIWMSELFRSPPFTVGVNNWLVTCRTLLIDLSLRNLVGRYACQLHLHTAEFLY